MRVITGSAKGYTLKVPKSAGTRPTPARAKEAMFSSLGNRVLGARVLDLFAGSGAFGIEALSRGARDAVFVEIDGMACAAIRQNLQFTHLEENATILSGDLRDTLEGLAQRDEKFDIVFADPPYLKGVKSNAESVRKKHREVDWKSWLLASQDLKSVLSPDGVLLLEYFKYDAGTESALFAAQKEFRFGDTLITLFTHA